MTCGDVATATGGEAVAPEAVEEALDILGAIITRDGPVYLPIYQRLERELERMRAAETALDRAHRRAAAWGAS